MFSVVNISQKKNRTQAHKEGLTGLSEPSASVSLVLVIAFRSEGDIYILCGRHLDLFCERWLFICIHHRNYMQETRRSALS